MAGQESPADILDRAHLARQTDGDRALAAELLALFEAQALEITGRIAAGETSAPLAHRLKGAARAVGAWAVAEAAEGVETGTGGLDGLEVAVSKAVQAIAAQR